VSVKTVREDGPPAGADPDVARRGEEPERGGARTIIDTRGLAKSYKRVHALKPLDLKVSESSIFGFLGPNGAGKSTTIKLLLGLVKPTAGSGTVFGRDITAGGVEIRRRVGYLAQEPQYYGHMTARQTLRFAARFFYSGPESAIERRVSETLRLVGLDDRADRRIKGFSGGERQRLGLAQAQVNEPELLILDEPAASLDPMGRRDVLAVIERLREERGATVFYSTHILDDVQRVSDAVAILKNGRLVAQAPIEELLTGGTGSAAVYELVLKEGSSGGLNEARERLRAAPWVSSLEENPENGRARWLVGVTDEDAAEEGILRLVLEGRGVRVASFGRKRRSLEEVFLGLVEGGSRDAG
jgi:ABC-2 type transport system ATP-binding protein